MVNKNLDFEFEHLGKPLKKKKREREMKITKLAMNTNEPEEPFFQNFMLPYEKI